MRVRRRKHYVVRRARPQRDENKLAFMARRTRKHYVVRTRRDLSFSRRDVSREDLSGLFRDFDNHLSGPAGPVLSDAFQESGFVRLGKDIGNFIRATQKHGTYRKENESSEHFTSESIRIGRVWESLRHRIHQALIIIEREVKYGPVKWYVPKRHLGQPRPMAYPVWEVRPGSGTMLSYKNPAKPGLYLAAMARRRYWPINHEIKAIPEEIFDLGPRKQSRFRIPPGGRIFVKSER